MKDKEPMIIRGDYLIEMLNLVSNQTLEMIRRDLGDETFANHSLIKVVEKTILLRKKREVMENLETLSMEPPEFWD